MTEAACDMDLGGEASPGRRGALKKHIFNTVRDRGGVDKTVNGLFDRRKTQELASFDPVAASELRRSALRQEPDHAGIRLADPATAIDFHIVGTVKDDSILPELNVRTGDPPVGTFRAIDAGLSRMPIGHD